MNQLRSAERLDSHDVMARIRELEKSIYELRLKLRDSSEAAELAKGSLNLLVCRCADRTVAFDLEVINEVVPAAQLDPIPEAPAWVSGTLTLRGVSISVLDVAARVNKGSRQLRVSDRILIVKLQEATYGLIVQEIQDIVSVERPDIQLPPVDLDVAPYVIGTVASDGHVIYLLSAHKLIAYSDIPESA